MNVCLAFNIKKSKPSMDPSKQVDLEFDTQDVIDEIKASLESLGHKVFLLEADENSFLKLKELKGKVDIVFNIAEGLWGDARESQIPIFCEILRIPYTHSGPTTHGIGLDKSFTKLVLKGADHINVPESHVVLGKDYIVPDYLKFPLIVKPNNEGNSKGVFDANVVDNLESLRQRVEAISENFTKEVLIEEYIDGREFTVAVLGNEGEWKVLPIIEQKFDFLPKGMNKIASFELKWLYEDSLKDLHDAYDCPAKVTEELKKEIEETSKQVCNLLDVRECARIDYRLNQEGKLYFLEINTLPGINPDPNIISYFPLAARTAGMTYKGFEVMEAGFNAKLLSLPAKDLLSKLEKETKKIPVIKFYSIDIHSFDYPAHTFIEEGFDFISICPCRETALGIIGLIKSKKAFKLPIRLIACDKGAVSRTQLLAEELIFNKHARHSSLQIIYLEKKRVGAGRVLGSEIAGVEEWEKFGKKIKKKTLRIPQKPNFRNTILIYSDDMIDTGGTAEKDFEFISSIYPNSTLKIFVATHPVFSKGLGALKRIGADYFVLGNTLSIDGLEEVKGVILVDLAPAIYTAIQQNEKK